MSGCAHGCEEGWIYVGDAARSCKCRQGTRSEFDGDYAPGGTTSAIKRKQLARRNGRKGGLASGIKRRQMAKGRRAPRARSKEQAIALAYPHRQQRRQRVYELYEQVWPCPERPSAAVSWEKGRATLWEHYAGTFKLYRACGQHARTTNAQRALALEARRKPRCRRQIQRLNRKLDAMGLAVVSHFKDQRDRPGHKDCLVVEIRTPRISHVTPPLRGSNYLSLRSRVVAAARDSDCNSGSETALVPPAPPAMPPDGGDQQQPASPASTERWEELRRELRAARFRRPGWEQPSQESFDRHRLEAAQARLFDVQRSGQGTALIAVTSSAGFR